VGVRERRVRSDVARLVSTSTSHRENHFSRFVESAERDVGPVNILVNNAGMMPVQPFARETESVSRTTIGVNLVGVLNGMRAVAPGMNAAPLGPHRERCINGRKNASADPSQVPLADAACATQA